METQLNHTFTNEDGDTVRYADVYLVQRLQKLNNNADTTFGRRFKNDYMGAAEFEVGKMAAALRELHVKARRLQLPIDGRLVVVLYNSDHFNAEGVAYVLDELYTRKRQTKEFTQFTRDAQKEIRDNRKRGDRYMSSDADAWFDIDHGLFWTFLNVNLGGIQNNIKLSVELMDANLAERAQKEAAFDQQEREAIDPLRAQMIADGRIRVRRQ